MPLLKKNLTLQFKSMDVAYKASSYLRGIGMKYSLPSQDGDIYTVKVTLADKKEDRLEFIYKRFEEWGIVYRAVLLGDVVKEQKWNVTSENMV